MIITEAQLCDIVQRVWTAMLGTPIAPVLDDSRGPPESISRSMIGILQITGAWEGSIVLQCPDGLARAAASVMFGSESGDIAENDIRDALGELTSVVGGHIKALLPTPIAQALPAVVQGSDFRLHIVGSRAVIATIFESKQHLFTVTIFEKEQEDAAPTLVSRS